MAVLTITESLIRFKRKINKNKERNLYLATYVANTKSSDILRLKLGRHFEHLFIR